MHGAPGGVAAHGPCGGVDFHDSVGPDIRGAAMSGPHSLNGTYDRVVFAERAVEIIRAAGADSGPLFLYVAWHIPSAISW